MNRKSTTRQQLLLMVTVVTMISALVGVVAVEMPLNEAFITTTAAFAKAGNNYESNQSLNPMNECGNGNFPLDVLCKNLGSEVYDNMNSENLLGTLTSDITSNGHGNEGGGTDH
ncbi:MAG: hypothetical protein ACRD8W_29385 [Nitrososphaeraceae archaeon]